MNNLNLSNGLGFRPAKTSDTTFINKLFEETNAFLYLSEQETDYIRFVMKNQQAIQQVSYETQSPNQMIFIIEKQSTAIGKLVIDFGHNFAHIIDLAIIKEAQNKGYGRSIIQAVQHIAQQQGLPVGLSVDKNNLEARKLYQLLGFAFFQDLNSHQFLMWYPAKSKEFA